ncbi:hypothetical protein EDD15DRAFT_2201917 [Pisolithus albus]|nr:hypothetical protein EDD15DRAFT_2201917 [Pisolithus albus]
MMLWRWVVFGGDEPGIYHTCPYIRCGRSTPPLPLAIECTSVDEAKVVMQTLQTVLNPILPEPSTHELVRVISASPAIQNLLNDADGFYAVVVGRPPGVHRTEEGAIRVGASCSWPKWKRTDTLCDALAYMVVKGIEAQLPPVVHIQVPASFAGAAYFCTYMKHASYQPSYEYHQMIFRLKFLYKIPVTLPKTCSKAEKTSMQKFNVHDPKRGKLKDDTKNAVHGAHKLVISNMTDSFFPMYPPSRRELRLITLIRYKALPPEGDKFTVHAINTVFNIPACDPFDVPSGYYEHVRRFLWRHHLFMEVEKRTDDLSVAVGLRSRVQRYIACMDAMIGGLFVKARSFEGSDWRSTLFDLYLIVDHHVQGHEYRQGHLWRLNNPDRILETVDVTTLGTLIWLINSRSPAADGCLTGAARPDPIHPTISQCPSATFTGPAQHPHLFIVPPSTPVCPYLYVFIPGTCSGLSRGLVVKGIIMTAYPRDMVVL